MLSALALMGARHGAAAARGGGTGGVTPLHVAAGCGAAACAR
eukprot:gene1055-34380_t